MSTMSNEQRYRLNRLASTLVTPERYRKDWMAKELIIWNRLISRQRTPEQRYLRAMDRWEAAQK